MRYCQIQRNFRDSEYLCKLGKEYLNHCYASFILFSRQNLQTFDISHAFLPLTIAKLSTFKNGPVFLAHPVHVQLYSAVCHSGHIRDVIQPMKAWRKPWTLTCLISVGLRFMPGVEYLKVNLMLGWL